VGQGSDYNLITLIHERRLRWGLVSDPPIILRSCRLTYSDQIWLDVTEIGRFKNPSHTSRIAVMGGLCLVVVLGGVHFNACPYNSECRTFPLDTFPDHTPPIQIPRYQVSSP